MFDLDVDCKSSEELSLEEEFNRVYNGHMAEIDEYLNVAYHAIEKAEALSEKYGLPFNSGTSNIGQAYTPSSYFDKFNGIDDEFISELTGVYPESYAGWQHSEIC